MKDLKVTLLLQCLGSRPEFHWQPRAVRETGKKSKTQKRRGEEREEKNQSPGSAMGKQRKFLRVDFK